MNKEFEKYTVVILLLILVVTGLSGCAKTDIVQLIKPTPTTAFSETGKRQAEDTTINENGPTDFQGIANILGCVFAPQSCQDKEDNKEANK